uniref:asparaginase n=1 Tax=Hemiselmis andersenii TaxID=464988 RepID=A0A6U2EM40_HEMAN
MTLTATACESQTELLAAQGAPSNMKAKLLCLYTGGTMGMKHNSAGMLEPIPGYLTEQIQDILNCHTSEALPDTTVVEYDTLLDSCDMNPENWKKIALDIQDNYQSYDGFLVIMGTDTMAYLASALSFMLENLGKTVVVTGSQIPFVKTYSDARRNLLSSMTLACSLDIPEVTLFFDDKLHRGNRSRKADSGSFDAFSSPNFPPLATMGLSVQVNKQLLLPQPKARFKVHTTMDFRVVVIKYVPYFDTNALMRLAKHGGATCRAIVLELYGTGNGPQNDERLLSALHVARQNGIVVVITSQCAAGSVLSTTYSINHHLTSIGVVPAGDMTTEATCAKLAYLFGKGLSPDAVATSLTVNLRGEIGNFSQGAQAKL